MRDESVHRILHPTSVANARTPLWKDRTRRLEPVICPTEQVVILQRGGECRNHVEAAGQIRFLVQTSFAIGRTADYAPQLPLDVACKMNGPSRANIHLPTRLGKHFTRSPIHGRTSIRLPRCIRQPSTGQRNTAQATSHRSRIN